MVSATSVEAHPSQRYPHSVNGEPRWGERAKHFDIPVEPGEPCRCGNCRNKPNWYALWRAITKGRHQFEVCDSKHAPFTQRRCKDLKEWEFFHPTVKMCQVIVVDIDRSDGDEDIATILPPELAPSAYIQTTKGWQAFWAIEPVWLPGNRANVNLLKHVAYGLRRVLGGDPAVDPIRPYKVRNPLYKDVRRIRYNSPKKIRNLGELRDALRGVTGLSAQYAVEERKRRQSMRLLAHFEADFADLSHYRNEAVFRLVLKAAQQGMAGQDLDDYAVQLAERCTPPLPVQETHGMARRCESYAEGFVKRLGGDDLDKTEISSEARQWLSEMGKKGGGRKTAKQQEALAQGRIAGNVVKSAKSAGRKAQIQALKEAGYTQLQIAEKTGLSRSTIKRAWK